MKSILILLAALSASVLSAGENASWFWHEKTPLDHTTRYFRMTFTLPSMPVKSAVAFSVDDIATIYVNGERQQRRQSLETTVRDLTPDLVKGKNVIALEAGNVTGAAGVIVRGVFTFADGKTLAINGNFKSSDREQPDWTIQDFDDSTWSKAALIGPCNMATWRGRVDHKPFLDTLQPGSAKK